MNNRARNGQKSGAITESIMRRIFGLSELEQVPEAVMKIGGNNGFDHLLLKRDKSGKIIDAVVIDSKQKSPAVRLSELKNGDVQMKDAWVRDVIKRIKNSSNQPTLILGGELETFLIVNKKNKIKLKVAAIDRSRNEIWIMNIGSTS